MGFNLRLLLHVVGIFITLGLLTYAAIFTNYYATMLTLTLILAFQIAGLQRCITSTNRLLARFLAAIKFEDYSQSFQHSFSSGAFGNSLLGNKRLNSSFADLGRSMDEVMQHFRQSRSDQEVQASYLKALVEQIPIAVCSINEEGKILFSNYAFNSLIKRTNPKTIEDLRGFNSELVDLLKSITSSRGQTLKITRNRELLHLKISCTTFRSMGKHEKLISIQNIQSDLEATELQAWQNLIRVMTHEIMNSVTPITSLSETANHYIVEALESLPTVNDENSSASETKQLLEDAADATLTIGSRGQGLIRFVESYRSLTKLPKPNIRSFALSGFSRSVENLMRQKLEAKKVALNIAIKPENLQLRADPELLEQAFINLMNNAVEALENCADPKIDIVFELIELGRIRITVTDNGTGIKKDDMENVFIPFFTTKRGGSGIGMSIVRQIVKLNGGSIHIESQVDEGTSVVMVF